MKVLILGATGETGKHLLPQALAKGHEVTALVRDPAKLAPRERVTVIKGEASMAADIARAMRGQQAVLSALGPRSKSDAICPQAAEAVVRAMKEQSVKRVVWLSASGVGDSKEASVKASFVFGRIIMPLFLAKPYANHARAEEIFRVSDLDWTILRPLQLTDSPAGRPAVAVPITPDATLGSLKVARQDLAALMLEELEDRKHLHTMPMVHG